MNGELFGALSTCLAFRTGLGNKRAMQQVLLDVMIYMSLQVFHPRRVFPP